jgi:formate hydrogenlyase subunit 4
MAPPVVAACLMSALAIVPIAGRAGNFGLGHDAIVVVGLLALARFALAAAAWDTGSGFALMGAARDLMIAVFAEALLLLAFLVAALPAHSTDLRSMSAAAAGGQIWSGPTHWCGAMAFALMLLVETGRQPIDNPDTHLELTMIHEGPLLEYGGRDLALLQWAAAARHWVMLLLGAELFLPHWRAFGLNLGLLTAEVAALCVGLAVIETYEAKMRLLRVPALLGVGCLIALAGAGLWIGGVGA